MGENNNPIRFSALIREFWVDKSHKIEESHENYGEENIKAYTESNPEKDLLTYTRHCILNILYSMVLVYNGLMAMRMKGKRFVV